MALLNYSTLVVDFKTKLHEILKFYFDGGTHEVCDSIIDFPEAKITYTIQDLDRPNGLVIAFIASNTSNSTKEKCANPNNLSLPGVELRADILNTCYMVTPLQGGDNTKNLLALETYWSYLHTLFSQYDIFSEVGILFPELQEIPSPASFRHDIGEVSGSFSCEVRSQFARYNT